MNINCMGCNWQAVECVRIKLGRKLLDGTTGLANNKKNCQNFQETGHMVYGGMSAHCTGWQLTGG